MAAGVTPARDPIVQFGDFELDTVRRTLTRRGIRLKIQQQPLRVLELLISRAPKLVSRDEIRHQVWGDNVHIDAEQSINFCIRHIRSVLCDDSANPRFIRTFPRAGYQFVGVIVNQSIEIEEPTPPMLTAVPDLAARPQRTILWSLTAIGIALVLATVIWLLQPASHSLALPGFQP